MVRTDEAQKAQVSVGTAALLEYLHQQPNSDDVEYTFCLGADAFMDLTAGKWKESARVLELLRGRCLVLHRRQTDNQDTTIHNHALQARVESVPGATLVSMASLGAVSSSRVREAVAANDWQVLQQDAMVHPDVLAYIREKGLYRPNPEGSNE